MRTISTHAPAGGATRAGVSRREVQVRISTHAPAGGATGYGRRRVRTNTKFLLTPLREGRQGFIDGATGMLSFLLTPLREGRPRHAPSHWRFLLISTHAPAGGATLSLTPICGSAKHFYSRPCGRGDRKPRMKLLRPIIFLLTPLREGRHRPFARLS